MHGTCQCSTGPLTRHSLKVAKKLRWERERERECCNKNMVFAVVVVVFFVVVVVGEHTSARSKVVGEPSTQLEMNPTG